MSSPQWSPAVATGGDATARTRAMIPCWPQWSPAVVDGVTALQRWRHGLEDLTAMEPGRRDRRQPIDPPLPKVVSISLQWSPAVVAGVTSPTAPDGTAWSCRNGARPSMRPGSCRNEAGL